MGQIKLKFYPDKSDPSDNRHTIKSTFNSMRINDFKELRKILRQKVLYKNRRSKGGICDESRTIEEQENNI